MPNTEHLNGQRQYELLLQAAREQLASRDAGTIAECAGIEYDAQAERFSLETLGSRAEIGWPDCRALSPMDMWHHLTLLQILAGADGARPDDRWITLSDIAGGGTARGGSFDRDIQMAIEQRVSPLAPEAVEAQCAAMGGRVVEDRRADLCADFFLAPRYPLRLRLWYADEEFPASGKVFVNGGVGHVLGVEAAGTAAIVLIKRLTGTY